MKKSLAVIFGGHSCEHDVSIITGLQALDNADTEKYDLTPIYVSRSGEWYTGEGLRDVKIYRDFDNNRKGLTRAFLDQDGLREVQSKAFAKPKVYPIDVVIPAIHGMNGEDGTIQGLFEMCGVPYTSAGVAGSAVGMDKIVMKRVFRGCNFPVLDDYAAERAAFERNRVKVLDSIEQSLTYPLFIKPANLGSSIGISKATDRESLTFALEVAFRYDRRVLVEQAVTELMEINCSCLGYGSEVEASVCEMPVSWEEFLSFDDKYMRGGKGGSKGMGSLSRKIPAPISDELTAEIQELSKQIFMALDCKGVVRIDYLYDKAQEKLFIGEINTVPGSFSFYLWEPMGISFRQLIDRLVDIAFKAQRDKDMNCFAFDSAILNKPSISK